MQFAVLAFQAMVEQVKDVPTREVLQRRMVSREHVVELTGDRQPPGPSRVPGSSRNRFENETQFSPRPHKESKRFIHISAALLLHRHVDYIFLSLSDMLVSPPILNFFTFFALVVAACGVNTSYSNIAPSRFSSVMDMQQYLDG